MTRDEFNDAVQPAPIVRAKNESGGRPKAQRRRWRTGGKGAMRLKQREARKEEEVKQRLIAEKVSEAYGQGVEEGQKASQNHMKEVFSEIFGSSVEVINLKQQPKVLAALSREEHRTNLPLSSDNHLFDKLGVRWIESTTSRIVIGWDASAGDERTGKVIFMVRITPECSFSIEQGNTVPMAISAIMDWTMAVHPIRTNGSQKRPSLFPESLMAEMDLEPVVVGSTSKVAEPSSNSEISKPCGNMFGAGFHSSMERSKVFVAYAPKRTNIGQQKYIETIPRLPHVYRFFREGLASLNFKAFSKLSDASHHFYIPNFGDINFNGTSVPEEPFANSLTITRDDFANFLHHDNDHIDSVSYGFWWAASSTKDGYIFNPKKVDHDMIGGGEFIFGNYGIGVRFQGCKGTVEILWHGKHNAHCTLQSWSPENVTRFGTSVQLTQAGHLAMSRFWGGNSTASLITPYEARIN